MEIEGVYSPVFHSVNPNKNARRESGILKLIINTLLTLPFLVWCVGCSMIFPIL